MALGSWAATRVVGPAGAPENATTASTISVRPRSSRSSTSTPSEAWTSLRVSTHELESIPRSRSATRCSLSVGHKIFERDDPVFLAATTVATRIVRRVVGPAEAPAASPKNATTSPTVWVVRPRRRGPRLRHPREKMRRECLRQPHVLHTAEEVHENDSFLWGSWGSAAIGRPVRSARAAPGLSRLLADISCFCDLEFWELLNAYSSSCSPAAARRHGRGNSRA